MNLLDSSVWIEHLTGGARLDNGPALFDDPAAILVSTMNLFEVGRYVLRTAGEEQHQVVLAHMEQCAVRPVDSAVARTAVQLAAAYNLHMADALIAATAQLEGADLVTLDEDLLALPFARRPGERG